MFEMIGVLAVVAVIGFAVMAVGYHLFQGVMKLLLGGVGLMILLFALRGCMM